MLEKIATNAERQTTSIRALTSEQFLHIGALARNRMRLILRELPFSKLLCNGPSHFPRARRCLTSINITMVPTAMTIDAISNSTSNKDDVKAPAPPTPAAVVLLKVM